MLCVMLLMPTMVSANDFKMKDIQHPDFNQSHFPFISSEKYPQSAANINAFMQYDFFEKIFKEKEFLNKSLSPFRMTDDYRRVHSIYSIEMTEQTNYLEVEISGDSCGAYCERFNNTYVFDIYSGQLITLIDLLSLDGIKQLKEEVLAKNRKRIEPYLENPPVDDSPEFYDGVYYLYKYCYDELEEFHSSVDEDTSFSLKDEAITIIHGRCSNHAARAIDEVGQLVNVFTFKELQPYFSAEGKQYLSDQHYQLPSIKTPYKVLHGKIAHKYPITILKPKHGSWVYWYDKYRSPLELRESTDKATGELLFKETHFDDDASEWIDTALWRVKKANDAFSGTFTRLSDGKKMSVVFK